jgi:hypothetical protein
MTFASWKNPLHKLRVRKVQPQFTPLLATQDTFECGPLDDGSEQISIARNRKRSKPNPIESEVK